ADANGDGKLDLAVANAGTGTVGFLAGNGDGTFGGARSFSAGGSPADATLADVNGDGLPDLSAGNPTVGAPSGISLRLNTTPAAGRDPRAATGTVLAPGRAAAPTPARRLSYTPPAGGTYYARVNGRVSASYTLVATLGAAFEAEPNDTFLS